MLEQLFGSKTRFRVLRLFFREPDRPFFVREMGRLLGMQINAIRRELALLLRLGIIKESSVSKDDGKYGAGLRKYYSLDKSSLLYPELQGLLLKAQVLGEQEFVKQIKERGGKIKLFILTGQFCSDPKVPSDLLLVGSLKERALSRVISKYEKELGFEIRYTMMTEQEFRDRRHVMDKFLYALFEARHHKVIDQLLA